MGLREIARGLNEKGVPTARGGKWYAGTIKYILENPLYKGMAHYEENNLKKIRNFNSFRLNICIKNIYLLHSKVKTSLIGG
ncbi:MAG: recombinase family protein [Caldisericota bacterium]|nr:recombinase family protein [Caldisericota bacterium]